MADSEQDKSTESQINIGKIVGKDHKYELSVSNETAEDAAVRRAREIADAELSRKMTYALFCFALLIVSIIFLGCVLYLRHRRSR